MEYEGSIGLATSLSCAVAVAAICLDTSSVAMKFAFLRVYTLERFSEILLFRPQVSVFLFQKWFYRVEKVGYQCYQIYPRMEFLEQNFES
jgi:hypothetical protein